MGARPPAFRRDAAGRSSSRVSRLLIQSNLDFILLALSDRTSGRPPDHFIQAGERVGATDQFCSLGWTCFGAARVAELHPALV